MTLPRTRPTFRHRNRRDLASVLRTAGYISVALLAVFLTAGCGGGGSGSGGNKVTAPNGGGLTPGIGEATIAPPPPPTPMKPGIGITTLSIDFNSAGAVRFGCWIVTADGSVASSQYFDPFASADVVGHHDVISLTVDPGLFKSLVDKKTGILETSGFACRLKDTSGGLIVPDRFFPQSYAWKE